jgi:hypothetical protein
MVVCDESHTYLSSFGIHFVNLLRRVRLACVNAGQVPKEIKWVISTATISNPLELASQLSGLSPNDITLIYQSGAKAHERTVLVFQPQNSPNFACANLLSSLLNYDLKGLVFVNARRTAKQIFSLLSHHHGGWINNVDLFYGSLKPAQRKKRLEKLSLGRNKIIITTIISLIFILFSSFGLIDINLRILSQDYSINIIYNIIRVLIIFYYFGLLGTSFLHNSFFAVAIGFFNCYSGSKGSMIIPFLIAMLIIGRVNLKSILIVAIVFIIWILLA